MWRRRTSNHSASYRKLSDVCPYSPTSSRLTATPCAECSLSRKNAITRQYEKLFAMDGVKLNFTPEALDTIVDKAIEYKLGARGLRAIVETVMIDAMFDIPSTADKEFDVTADYVRAKLQQSHYELNSQS